MPGDIRLVLRLLQEDRGCPAENVRTKHVLNGIEYLRVADKLGERWAPQMRLLEQKLSGTGASAVLFDESLQALAVGTRFVCGQCRDRKPEACRMILRDRLRRE